LVGTSELEGDVVFTIDNSELATILPRTDPHSCVVHANKKNKLGDVVLSATYNNVTYTKTISIIPLW